MEKKDEKIISVQKSTFKYFSSHKAYYILFFILIALGLYFTYKTLKIEFLIGSILISFIPVFIISEKLRRGMMRQFAESLGYVYEPKADISSVEGNLFNRGHSRQISDVISGVNDGHNVRIFIYTFVVGSGKNSHTERYTVFENTFHSNLPHILLYKAIPFITLSDIPFSSMHRVSMEGDFDKYFSLHVEKEYEIEALQIFTPDFMQEAKEMLKDFSLEFYKNKLYIYKQGHFYNRKELDEMFLLADKICERIEPVADSIADDVEHMNTLFNKRSNY